jgi:hypothetical protein
MLCDYLLKSYPPEHQVIIYEAAILPINKARMDKVTLAQLPDQKINDISSLYIPPVESVRPRQEILTQFGMSNDRWHELVRYT